MSATLRRGAAVLAAVLLATLSLFATTDAQAAGPVRVMPLGDSITDGFSVPGGYRIDLWQKIRNDGITVDFVGSLANGPSSLGDRDHEGHSGWRIDQLDANIVNWLRTYTPGTILLHIGTNDITQNRDLPNAPNRLGALIDKINSNSPSTKVFVATLVPTSWGSPELNTYNAAIPQLVRTRAAAGKPVYLVDMFSALNTGDLADAVHPNASGYSKMATAWYNALKAVPGSLTDTGPSPDPSTPGPSPSTPGQTTPPPGPAGCTATVSVNAWTGGFVATIRVTAGSAAIAGWSVGVTLPSGSAVTNTWNASASGTGGALRFTNVSYNGRLGAGQATEFGFQGTGSATGVTPSCTAS